MLDIADIPNILSTIMKGAMLETIKKRHQFRCGGHC